MQVYGKTGYLSEYDLSSTVSEQFANGRKEYSGLLAVKHVGLCARDGPKETTGQIRFQVAPLQRWSSKESSVHTRGFSRSRIMAS
jgi:hypothetical protein